MRAAEGVRADDVPQSLLGTVGAVSGGIANQSRNPRVMLPAAAVSGAAALGGNLLDYLRGEKKKEEKSVLNKAEGGLASLPKFAGKGESLVRGGEALAKKIFTPRPTSVMKFSEAMAPHEGKYLGLTQTDNFGVHGGRMGGNQFPNFQNISPKHQEAGVVWMNDAEKHANDLVKGRKFNGKDVVYSTYIGGPDQLKSNKTVFNDILNAHYNRELTPEQYALINQRIATLRKAPNKPLVFSQPFDIRDKFAVQELVDTFEKRSALASMLGAGEGVGKTKGGIALPQYQDILRAHRDPLTEGVPTSSIGTRLFTVDDIPAQFSTEFHPDYNWAVFGKDQGVQFNPVPQRIAVPTWHGNYKERFPNKEPHGNAWFNYPKNLQFIDDKYLTNAQKEGYADGGLVHLQSGGNPKLAMLKAFADPAAKYLKDWSWKPMPEVAGKLDLKEVPDYIQGGYGQFMKDQAKRAAAGDLNARDLIKAYTITQSSIGRGGLSHATATKAGLKLPNTGGEVRPEGAFAEWLGSPMGQRYLDTAATGQVDPKALAQIQQQFAPFGKQNDLVEKMEYAAQTMPNLSQNLNQAILGDKDAYRNWAEQMKGVAGAKSGFIGSMLGRGDLPTFDARQINLHTANQAPVGISSIMNRGKGQGGREAVDRLAARQTALGLDIDPALDPFYQHLTHHAVWDKVGNNQTTHDDLVKAMRNYKDGGMVHMQSGGNPKMALIRAAMGKVLPQAERDANLQKFLLPSQEKRRMYHGTTGDINKFNPNNNITFLTPEPSFANSFAAKSFDPVESQSRGPNPVVKPGANVMPVHVQAQNIFNPYKPSHLDSLYDKLMQDYGQDLGSYNIRQMVHDVKNPYDNWQAIENNMVQKAIKELGHDSFVSTEAGVQNLGMYDPRKIKSAIGNEGTYNTGDLDINKAKGGLVHLQSGGSPKKQLGMRLATSAYDMLGLTPESVAAWRKANAKPYKQQQDPVLAQATDAYLNKQISQADYLRIMNERRPIRPLTAVPAAHSNVDIVSALDPNKVEKGILGLNLQVPEGTRVGNRLDIPAYERYGTYVDTMHDAAGKPIGYGHTGRLTDVQFKSSPTKAARVGLGTKEQKLTPMAEAEGQGKSPFAMMVGNQVNTSDDEVRRMLQEYLRDPEWHQIGMNPYRASQFYDKADMMPVWSAKEKIQAGPLVLARDIEKSDWTDPRLMTEFGVNYKEGGLTGLYANIHAKRERIKHGSGEKMRKPGTAGAPTAEAFRESAKTAKLKEGGTPSLSVGRGEKLSVDQGAGLTAKGRAKYNRETGSNLKAPQPEGGPRKDSFCARMQGVVDHAKGDAPRAKASLKRWKC